MALSSFGKCKEKPGIPFWGGRHASFPQKLLLKWNILVNSFC
jgi:hypothetical protein